MSRAALFTALALGVPYQRDAMGYEYHPAPGLKRDRPSRRSGLYTSRGKSARVQSWRRRNYEREVAAFALRDLREGHRPIGTGESWEHFIAARLARGVSASRAAKEWLGAS